MMVRERKTGFVFSLDAFVAFSLILIAIQSLLIVSAMPRGYYRGLLQAEYLASDTLQTLSLAQDGTGSSLISIEGQHIAAGSALSPGSPMIEATNKLIPKPYSYAYYTYDFGDQKWVELYNASKDNAATDAHHGVIFHRVQASAQMLTMGYADPLVVGQSPYCNVVCKGWGRINNNGLGGNTPAESCEQVPCAAQTNSTLDTGNFSVGVLRLYVWG